MTAQNKFALEDAPKATRTTAERISKESRRARREFNGTTKHFYLDPRVVEELSKEGHMAWLNDDLKGGLLRAEDLGYRYITNREAYGERNDLDPEAKAKVRYGTADKEGTPQDIYLMLQPWEFYNEDVQIREDANKAVDEQIQRGADDDVSTSYGKRIAYDK